MKKQKIVKLAQGIFGHLQSAKSRQSLELHQSATGSSKNKISNSTASCKLGLATLLHGRDNSKTHSRRGHNSHCTAQHCTWSVHLQENQTTDQNSKFIAAPTEKCNIASLIFLEAENEYDSTKNNHKASHMEIESLRENMGKQDSHTFAILKIQDFPVVF